MAKNSDDMARRLAEALIPQSVRLHGRQVGWLRKLAARRTYETGRTVGWQDLLREAVDTAFPMPEDWLEAEYLPGMGHKKGK